MPKRIHVVGSAPRTGTTLMTELIINGCHIDGFAEHEMSIFRRPPRRFAVFCSKNPRDVRSVGPLLRIDRDLWVVQMVRDPRDVVVSRHALDPQRYWANLRQWRSRRSAARMLVAHPRFLTVRYEDLVRDPDGVQQQLMECMPFLKKRANFSAYHLTAKPSEDSVRALGGVRPINADSIGAWRQHKPRLAAQLALHGSIDDDLIELGYEKDGNWVQALAGVQPDNGESHWPEHRSRSWSFRGIPAPLRVARYAIEMLLERLHRDSSHA